MELGKIRYKPDLAADSEPARDTSSDLVKKDPGKHPKNYVVSSELVQAVNVAITLGRPLLVTGESGLGKSELARSVAFWLDFGDCLEFVVKSDTTSTDLFYRFDTMGRFNTRRDNGAADGAKRLSDPPESPPPDARRIEAAGFIAYEALGEAILKSQLPKEMERFWPPGVAKKKHKNQQRSVVLIDEIDKAPRDVPNDILTEIDRLEFTIPEFSQELGKPVTIKADPAFRPIVIITSNQEKNLPDAFLRRCVFYHMTFPDSETLDLILAKRLGERYAAHSAFVREARALFEHLRKPELRLSKPPSTAELLDWLFVLFESVENQVPARLVDHPLFRISVKTTLLKIVNDYGRGDSLIESWSSAKSSPSE